jgi:nucleoporin NUP2
MNPTTAKNVVSFMGHEDGASLPYKIRVKTNDLAEQVKRVLQEEVEKAKAKSS